MDDVFYNRFADQDYSFTGFLPHLNQAGKLQFITFHLADSLPQSKLRELRQWRALFFATHPLPWSDAVSREYSETISNNVSALLDNGLGSCCLRQPEARRAVTDSLHFLDGKRYELLAYVVMPNHVHLLVCVYEGQTVGDIVKSLKAYTTRAVNGLLRRSGPLWQRSYFDRIIRNPVHLDRCLDYIRANPRHLPPGTYSLYVKA